jgi:hypothetical protein
MEVTFMNGSETGAVHWHYTTDQGLKGILRDQVIRPATTAVDLRECPIVWFSTNQDWENTVVKALKYSDGRLVSLKTPAEMVRFGVRAFRIGVLPKSAPFHWCQLKKMGRIKPKVIKGLVRSAIEMGADPSEWRGTFEPVPATEWISLQEWDGGKWSAVEVKLAMKTTFSSCVFTALKSLMARFGEALQRRMR